MRQPREEVSTLMTGTCVSCGQSDVEVNEQGECTDCTGGSTEATE